jgi:hypothetical protein
MSQRALGRRVQLGLALVALLVVPASVAAQSESPTFRPACQLAADAAASAALGVDVVGDDSISNLFCTYMADGGATVAIVTLTADLPLDLVKLALPGVTEVTIAGSAALTSPGDEAGSMPPAVLVGLADGGVLMINVMPDVGVTDPLAGATALAEALLAGGPVTATLPEEVSGPAIEATGDPCELATLDELGDIVGATFTTAEPDGAGGCMYQTDMTESMVLVGLTFSDGTLAPLRSGSTTDLTVGDRSAIWWPDLSSLLIDVGGGRILSVSVMSLSAPVDEETNQARDQAVAIAELAVGRMTPTADG